MRRYFQSCSSGTAADVAACFTPEATIFDTNFPPVCGAEAVGKFWMLVRRRWGGARWTMDRAVAHGDDAACEWTMAGVMGSDGRTFRFHGSDHYRFDGDLIAEVRQYWTFDATRLDTCLLGFAYEDDG
jgi:ketosteroid isomerase-like protein